MVDQPQSHNTVRRRPRGWLTIAVIAAVLALVFGVFLFVFVIASDDKDTHDGESPGDRSAVTITLVDQGNGRTAANSTAA